MRPPVFPLFHSLFFSSEEDNDPFTDDGSSAPSFITSSRPDATSQHRIQGALTARSSRPQALVLVQALTAELESN